MVRTTSSGHRASRSLESIYINFKIKSHKYFKVKKFFRNILLKGNEKSKDLATQEVRDYYDYGDFRQDELFEYANIPDYYKERIKDYTKENEKDDYDLSR